MQRWLSRLLSSLGLLLIVLSLTSVLQPVQTVRVADPGLLLRQVGHTYLQTTGDSTSLIPPVEELTEGGFLLRLEREIDYDLLGIVTQQVLRDQEVRQEYELRLTDPETGEVFLGGFWPDPLLVDAGLNTEMACSGRDQEARPANVRLTMFPLPVKSSDEPTYWLLIAGSMFLFLGVLQRRLNPTPKPILAREISPDEPIGLQLGNGVYFDTEAQQLRIGDKADSLTFREAKLLTYLFNNRNQVLERQNIHDAVWGDEGVMVGRSLDVFVSRLRKKLANVPEVEIQTIHGVGYRFRNEAKTHFK